MFSTDVIYNLVTRTFVPAVQTYFTQERRILYFQSQTLHLGWELLHLFIISSYYLTQNNQKAFLLFITRTLIMGVMRLEFFMPSEIIKCQKKSKIN